MLVRCTDPRILTKMSRIRNTAVFTLIMDMIPNFQIYFLYLPGTLVSLIELIAFFTLCKTFVENTHSFDKAEFIVEKTKIFNLDKDLLRLRTRPRIRFLSSAEN
jgi:hypothetical protein